MHHQTTKHKILYIEDDLDDLEMVKMAFTRYKDVIELVHIPNGLEAIEFLKKLSPEDTLPCLIILDINMPVMDGKETLVRIKELETLQEVPVTLFTTSNSVIDQMFAKRWGAGFITKPLKYEELENLAEEFSKKCRIDLTKNP